MKIIGLVMLIVICTGVGLLRYEQDARHEKQLKQLLLFLDDVRSCMRSMQLPMNEILRYCNEKDCYRELKFISQCDQLLQQGVAYDQAFSLALQQTDSGLALASSEKMLLRQMGAYLGTTDLESQLEMIIGYKQQLQSSLETIQQKRHSMGRMYITLGFLIGMGAAIVLA